MSGHETSSPSVADLLQKLAKLDRRVGGLTAEVREIRAENKRLRRENKKLQERVRDLEAQLGLNSQNSSLPPSSDLPWTAPKRTPRERIGRKPGGQPGHDPHQRVLVPEDKLAESYDVKPSNCSNCGAKLRGNDPEPFRHQVTDLPPKIEPYVTEHRLHSLECPCCGTVTRAELPDDVPRSGFGPRLVAIVAILSGVYRLSHRMMVAAVSDLFGIDMSLGSVTACQRQASEALAKPVEEAREFVKQRATKQADETSWFQGPKREKVWLWVVHTQLVSVFLIHVSRGADAAREILGEAFGYLISDRWSGYNWWPLMNRQICWAHLKRQFQGFVDLGGAPAKIGEGLLDQVEKLFEMWCRVRDGTLLRSSFQTYISPIRLEVESLLEKGTRCRNKKTAGRCAAILKVFPALWTFARVEGTEPTNNASERSIRPGVIWRKLSFGTHSLEGSKFVERMLTVTLTLRQQGRNVLRYVTDAVVARQTGVTPGSLLPAVS